MSNHNNVSPEDEYKSGLACFGEKKYPEAFQMWLSAANRGYFKAMCDVGWMYSQGNGVEKNEVKAFEFMLRSAQNGYVRAQNNIGLYYKNGTGTAVDIEKAVYWLEKAQAKGYEQLAVNTLNNCKKMLLQKQKGGGNAKGDADDEHKRGMEAFTKSDYNLAFTLWKAAAANGNAEAMCDVGWMYSQGKGVKADSKKAFQYMLRSAEKGYVRAQNNIGLYYKTGTGVEINYRKSVEWLTKAEVANYPKLARKTLQEARDIIMLSNNEKYAHGLELFGKQKYKEAFGYWLCAAESPPALAKAMCDVGWMYSQGYGVEKDFKIAFSWMLKAAQAGYVRAQNNVGLYYKNGTGCAVDISLAVEWLEKAEAVTPPCRCLCFVF